MAERKPVIQVPMDEDLLKVLDRLSARQRRPRAAVIREACQRYAARAEREQLDRQYEEGYLRLPEETALADAQAEMSPHVLEEEHW